MEGILNKGVFYEFFYAFKLEKGVNNNDPYKNS